MVKRIVVIRGAGDMATGVAWRLYRAGIPFVMIELPKPTMVRRLVSFGEAVYNGTMKVEGVRARHVRLAEIDETIAAGEIPVVTEPYEKVLATLQPEAIVDVILAKQNLGTSCSDAPITIGVGPGFSAPEDVQAVVETQRGHQMGRVYYKGMANPDTGIPGDINGYTFERVLYAPVKGVFHARAIIGDRVEIDEIVGYVDLIPIVAKIDGILRGLLQDGLKVTEGFKLGDIDHRCKEAYCYMISDKACSIGGGVLEALLHLGWYRAGHL